MYPWTGTLATTYQFFCLKKFAGLHTHHNDLSLQGRFTGGFLERRAACYFCVRGRCTHFHITTLSSDTSLTIPTQQLRACVSQISNPFYDLVSEKKVGGYIQCECVHTSSVSN